MTENRIETKDTKTSSPGAITPELVKAVADRVYARLMAELRQEAERRRPRYLGRNR